MVRWLNDDERTTWMAYIGLRQRLDAEISAGLAVDGLSYADYELLVPLSTAPGGCMRAKDLAAVVCWQKSRLSKHLARMASRGLVDRNPVQGDARGVLVALTDSGRDILRQAAPKHVELVRQLFIDDMDEGEEQAIRSLADKVVAASERIAEQPG